MQFRLFFIWVSNTVSTFSSSAQTVRFQLWFFAYHFAPSLFLLIADFLAVYKLFQHRTFCFGIYALHVRILQLLIAFLRALRIYLYIGITSLCLYNTSKYFIFQDGKLDKTDKRKLCNIQIKAKCAQNELTRRAIRDMINTLGRST